MTDPVQKVSDSYLMIWEAVRRIPRGKVATYGQVALASGLAGSARLVGYALHNLPYGSDIPWHRVVNAKGRISLPRKSGNHRRQRLLLEHEGVMFRRDTIDLDRFRWRHGDGINKERRPS